jgi:hypothetical protein
MNQPFLEDNDFFKSHSLVEGNLMKAKALPIGTIRDWKGKKYIKTAGGWEPHREKKSKKKAGKKKKEGKGETYQAEFSDMDMSEKEIKALAKKNGLKVTTKENDNGLIDAVFSGDKNTIRKVMKKTMGPGYVKDYESRGGVEKVESGKKSTGKKLTEKDFWGIIKKANGNYKKLEDALKKDAKENGIERLIQFEYMTLVKREKILNKVEAFARKNEDFEEEMPYDDSFDYTITSAVFDADEYKRTMKNPWNFLEIGENEEMAYAANSAYEDLTGSDEFIDRVEEYEESLSKKK